MTIKLLTATHPKLSHHGTEQLVPCRALVRGRPGPSRRWVVEEKRADQWLPLDTYPLGHAQVDGQLYHRLEFFAHYQQGAAPVLRVQDLVRPLSGTYEHSAQLAMLV
jgi:hypothetical protein